ncbi:hypothetical protein BD779DRAFT_1236743 [Infundibulicybe gibba]|nr:hypothetical protein BD779DRAFT_1236743 [Infundibulicybe gibba]
MAFFLWSLQCHLEQMAMLLVCSTCSLHADFSLVLGSAQVCVLSLHRTIRGQKHSKHAQHRWLVLVTNSALIWVCDGVIHASGPPVDFGPESPQAFGAFLWASSLYQLLQCSSGGP